VCKKTLLTYIDYHFIYYEYVGSIVVGFDVPQAS